VSDSRANGKWADNVVRESTFLAQHDGATIERLPPCGSIPYWRYRGVVPGGMPVESADLGELLDELEGLGQPATRGI
jgi:hypothetical protein